MTDLDTPFRCVRCGESPERGLPAYGKGRCHGCLAEFQRGWRAKNAGRINEHQRVRHRSDEFKAKRRAKHDPRVARRNQLLVRYGLTEHDFQRMRADQLYRCAICLRHESDVPKGLLCVDHCHGTGRVRGLLCFACNSALGLFQDDMGLFQRAVEYLQRR